MDIDSAVLRLPSVEEEESGAEKWTQSAAMVCSDLVKTHSQVCTESRYMQYNCENNLIAFWRRRNGDV